MITRLTELAKFLKETCGWCLPSSDPDDLLFQHSKSEFGFLRNEAAKVRHIFRLRPIRGLGKTVFLIDSHGHEVHRFAVRRLPLYFTVRQTLDASRQYIPLSEMVFLILCEQDSLAVAHFRGSTALTASMAVIGPFPKECWDELYAALDWEHFADPVWSLPTDAYTRFRRDRKGPPCTREALDRISPGSIPLFELACSGRTISQEEEDSLFFRFQDGNRRAGDEIFELNLGMAFDVAYRVHRKYSHCGVPFEDILDEAMDGLWRAITKYRPEEGHRFRSLAWQWVGSRAEKVPAETLFPIDVPNYVWEKLSNSLKDETLFNAVLSLGESEVLRTFGTSEHELAVCKSIAAQKEDHDWVTMLEDPPEWAEPGLSGNVQCFSENSAYWDVTECFLPCLTNREQDVIRLRFDLSGHGIKTLEEIGVMLNVTRERVRQIELRAIKKLRHMAHEGGLEINAKNLNGHQPSDALTPVQEDRPIELKEHHKDRSESKLVFLDTYLAGVSALCMRVMCPWSQIVEMLGAKEDTDGVRRHIQSRFDAYGLECLPPIDTVTSSGSLVIWPGSQSLS